MRNGARNPIFLLLLVCFPLCLLNLGCGGGGLPPSTQISQSPQTDKNVSQSMQSPMLGFVYATTGGELRAILGIPGASVLSRPLAVPPGVTNFNFAPGQKYAIVEGASGASIGVMMFPTANPGPLTEISGAISQPDIVSFSPNGASAVVYSASEGRLEVISGLPLTPRVAREISGADLPNAVRLLALADDGVTLLEGAINNSVYRLAEDAGPQLLDTVGDLEGMAFVPQSSNALIFDSNGGSLSLLQSANSTPSNRSLVDGLTGLGGKIALQVAAGTALITSASTNHLYQVDLQSLRVQNLQLPATATMLEPLRTSGKYLLSWQSGQPAWIVDTSGQTGVLYFVPAGVNAGANP
jgi:hypothetical protein